jgi:hypothetical protein
MDWRVWPHGAQSASRNTALLLDTTSEPVSLEGSGVTSRWPTSIALSRLTWCFVALGLLIRLVRYWVCYPLFPDEAFVAVNFLTRDFAGLLEPLDHSQVCPPLFLWIELAAVRWLGFCEWTLRLWPMLCGLASVVVFRFLAGRLLGGLPLLFAMALFATSAAPVRHSAEVKPYECDLLVALVLLSVAVEWWRAPDRNRLWWILALLTPMLFSLSNPAVFVAAGLSVALLPVVLAARKRSLIIAFAVYNLTLIGTFAVLYFAFTSAHSAALRSGYRWGYWRDAFPPWDQPWKLPLWLIETHTGNMLAYPVGDRNGASAATLALLLVGIAVLWRQGRRTPLWLLLAPFAMGLSAAALGQYPYGQAARVTLYQAPSICILTGLGIAALIRRFRGAARQGRYVALAVGAFAVLGCCWLGRDLSRPYRAQEDAVSRRFARWLWQEYGKDADVLCASGDLGLDLSPKKWTTGASAVYRCHRQICAPGTSERKPGIIDLASTACTRTRPVRLVFLDDIPRDNSRCTQWLAGIRAAYHVAEPSVFVVHPGGPTSERERYVVLELIPRETRQIAVRQIDFDLAGGERGSVRR